MKTQASTLPCPACGGMEAASLETSGDYRILACRACGLSYSDPMRGGDESWYQDHLIYADASPAAAEWHAKSADRPAHHQILDLVPQGGRVLDVGCGFGGFVKVARDRGFDAYGIDFNTQQISAGRKALGLSDRLFAGSVTALPDLGGDSRKFDLITLFEVIEHVESPRDLIRDVKALLKPGGILALSCPNEARWQPTGRIFVDYPPHHLTRWRPRTLQRFLETEGLRHEWTRLDCSLRDLLWVAYVNRSAAQRAAQRGEQESPGVAATGKSWKMSLFAVMGWVCAPFDAVLRLCGIGTMGMRVVMRKP